MQTVQENTMTLDRAVSVLGLGNSELNIRMMVTALSLHAWSNTPAENERLAAAKYAMRHRKGFKKLCEIRRRAK